MKFSEGLTAIQADDQCDFIDQTGAIVAHTELQPMTFISFFSEGLAKFMLDSKWGYVDKNGQVAITPKYDYATDFSMPDKTAGPNF